MSQRVAVIMGGWSGERPISLISGTQVLEALSHGGEEVIGFDLVPDGILRVKPFETPRGVKRVALSALLPALRRSGVDKCFLALHGPGGEDGRIQGMLDLGGVAYTGSGALASAVAMDKPAAKALFRAQKLPTPDWVVAEKGGKAPAFKTPCVVKPASQGSALGVSVARGRAGLLKGLKEAFRWDTRAVVERYIPGRELTVGVLGGRALPVVEIVPQKAEFYDFASKYEQGGSRHLCPAPLDAATARKAAALGLAAHRALGCRGYSRSDLMMDARKGLWILETNTLPGMTPVSLFPDAAKAAGMSYYRLLQEMLRLA